MISFDCACPPSTNRLWRTAHRNGRTIMYKDKAYDTWLLNTWKEWCFAKPKDFRTITSEVEIEVLIAPKRKRDADNSLKASLDALQKLQIIGNDSQAKRVITELVDKTKAPMGCRITVKALA